jgi:N,N-dimethylformamidase
MARAYLDSQVVDPGSTLRVHATGHEIASISVRQWQHSDPSPRGPGVLFKECEWGAGRVYLNRVETVHGSFAAAEDALPVAAPFTVSLWILRTSADQTSTVLSWRGSDSDWSVVIENERLALRGNGTTTTSAIPVRMRQWTFVGVAVPAPFGTDPSVVTLAAGHWGRTGGPFVEQIAPGIRVDSADSALRVGAPAAASGGDLDGLVAGLSVHDCALDIVELMDVMNGLGRQPLHRWAMDDRRNPDCVPAMDARTADLLLRNAPAWSAHVPPPVDTQARPLTRPGSIHFHVDDVEDSGWPIVHAVEVPLGTPSGYYTVRVADAAGAAEVPFVVTGGSTTMLLASTLTWQAYGNLGRDPETFPGRSLYSLHTDGSPVMINTALRPCPTLAPQARLEVDGGDGFAEGGGVVAHLLMADLYAWHWLTQEGVAPAVLDDRQLHTQGSSALDGVQVLVLSAHPEYWTRAMLDALNEFLDRGGSVIYLGGNGLYWVTSLHPAKPYLMEVRRWGGSQTWSVDEWDRRHQFEDCVGGLWADAGRPPNQFVGVGFAGFGTGPSLAFTRTAASYSDEWRWVFEGVEGGQIGAEGINVGAGNEFDSVDPLLATPGRTTVLASAEPDTPDHFATYEAGPGRAPTRGVRADLAITATPSGGLVLAMSSITASGCLVATDGPGPMRRVCSNVLRHMLAS